MTENVDLALAWRPEASELHGPGGKPIPFTDAALVVHNAGAVPLGELRATVTVRQEDSLLCEARDAMGAALGGRVLAPGESVAVGAFALLQEVDQGLASRVHLFGVKALLTWRFRVVAEVDCRAAGGASGRGKARAEFAFHWAPPESPGGPVGLVEDPLG